MGMTGIDVIFVQEMKIVDSTIAARSFAGYPILVAADSKKQADVFYLLMVKKQEGFIVKNEKAVGPNVICFELVTSRKESQKQKGPAPSSLAILTSLWMSLEDTGGSIGRGSDGRAGDQLCVETLLHAAEKAKPRQVTVEAPSEGQKGQTEVAAEQTGLFSGARCQSQKV